MSEEQRNKIDRRIMALSIGIIVVLIGVMVLVALAGKVETPIFPICISIFLGAHWIVSDVLAVRWRHSFEGKTDDQKKSYYVYAALDAAGLGGLVYFLADMNTTTGAIIYVACLLLKRKFMDEFTGASKETEKTEPDGETAEADGTSVPEYADGTDAAEVDSDSVQEETKQTEADTDPDQTEG